MKTFKAYIIHDGKMVQIKELKADRMTNDIMTDGVTIIYKGLQQVAIFPNEVIVIDETEQE